MNQIRNRAELMGQTMLTICNAHVCVCVCLPINARVSPLILQFTKGQPFVGSFAIEMLLSRSKY